MKHNITQQNPTLLVLNAKLLTKILFVMSFFITSAMVAQIGTQSPSVQTGVTFQWNDIQDINFDGDIDVNENDRPATIRSIIINDGTTSTVFDNFAIPTFYQLTRLGRGGSIGQHNQNNIRLNGSEIVGTSLTATMNLNDNNLWDTNALSAYQSKNLNYHFESNNVGRNICGDFDEANGTNGVSETDAQLQTIFYDPALPSNAGGILAVTERGGNNCYYIRMFGIPVGGGPEQVLGDTFVNNAGQDYVNLGFSPPLGGSDYWSSGRENDNTSNQDIAIAIFALNSIAPTGSLITKIEFVAATNDHGDGKFFILQRYAEDLERFGCEDTNFDDDIAAENNVPDTSEFSVESAPSPAGAVQSFNLNADGTYTLVPTPGFVGVITFDYGVCLPAPNDVICDTATVTVEFLPSPDPAVVEVSCPDNNSTAQITVISPIGAQYEYSLDGGAFQASAVFSNIGEGTYEVTVKNINTDCESDISTNVTFVEVEIEASTDVACFGASTGSIEINVSGGTTPYTFSWSNGATTEDLDNIPAGDYTVTVTGANGCSDSGTYTIGQPAEDITITGNVTDVACFGDASGVIDISVSGGTPGYSYSWSSGETTQDLEDLVAGTYTVTVLDANGCEKEASFTVTGPDSGLNISFTTVDVLCNGASTGSADITVSGGTTPYTYAWSNGATTEGVENLPADSYSVTVTDANGCTLVQSAINIEEPASPISIVISKVNATTAQGCADGEATATASGGTSPYTYQWSASAGNQTVATATTLTSGNHTVVVTDSNDCTMEQTVVIDCSNTCDQVIAVDEVVNVLCTSETTGEATVSASSVSNSGATYTFVWNTTPEQTDAGVTTSTITGQAAGVYTVSVTIDGTQCLPVEQSVTITEPTNALDVSASSTDESGPTTNDGTATANVSGGTPGYTYSWAPGGETTQEITGLDEGTYTVTVTDANGCTETATTIVNPGSCLNLAVTAAPTGVTCNGDSDGAVDATITGGSGNFTYSWDNGATTEDISALAGGVYTITVTDTVTLCTASANATVIEPNVLSSGIAVNSVLCFGESKGSLDLTVSGGTAPYSFAWSNGAVTEDINTIPAGIYTVTITDANDCVLMDSAEVLQPAAALTAQIDSQVDILCGAESSVTVAAQGGTVQYSYSLDGAAGQSSGTFTGLDAGSYVVTVTDGNACTTDVAVEILSNCTDAIADINNAFVNVPVDGNVLTNDEDAEGNTQTVTGNTDPANGEVVVNPDGSYTYTPDMDFVGEDSFEYTICDDGTPQACDTATVVIEVMDIPSNDENNPPVANNDNATTDVGMPVDISVLPNDFDPDGDMITVTPGSVTDPANGDVVLNPDGTITYTPDPDFTGEDTFTYEICDNGTPSLCDTATVTVTVNPENDTNETVANDDAYNGGQDEPITGSVLDNDSDPEGDSQTVNTTPVTAPENGDVVLNDDGTFVYTPDPDFVGTDSFVYSVCDDGTPQACDEATVVLTVNPVNTTDAIDDINDTFVNLPVAGNVLTNDEDAEGNTQTVTGNTDPANGSVVVNPDGSYTYTPNQDFVGEDSFEYTICDDGTPQACDTATVVIEVMDIPSNDENNPPVANNDTATTDVDEPVIIDVLPNDFDPDGDMITVTPGSATDPANGEVVINPDGTITYTPDSGFTGEDTFTYEICDNGSPVLCDEATVTVTVNPENDTNETVANDDAYNGDQDEPITGSVLDNDSDPEGDSQTVNTDPVTDPSNGTVVLNDDGTFEYTPDPDFVGTDSFVYSVCDDGTPQACDEATVVLTVNPVNTTDAIADINDTFVNLPVDGNVLTNDEDAEDNTQVVTANTDPANGSVVVNPDGSYTYTPDMDFVGEDSFEYTICDDGTPQACDTATVVIQIIPISGPDNEAPIANNDTATTEVDEPVIISVLPNDFDPDGDMITVTPGSATDPDNGEVVINPDGTITYTPDPGFTGEDTFEYQICDDGNPALCDTATVTVTVNPDNQENDTYANDDSYNTTADVPVLGNVLDNDTDPEGNDQMVNTDPVTDPSNGTVALNADGTFEYTPNPGYVGTDSFVYSVCDNGIPQACDEATVFITIGMTLIPDFGPTLFTGNTTVIGDSGVVDFRVFVAEFANQNSNGLSPVELRIIRNDDLVISFDNTLTTLNGSPVSNVDWIYDDSNPSLHRFIYVGNGGIFRASTASFFGINAVYNPPTNTNGSFPLKATVRFFSGGEVNNSNNDDLEFIEYNNN